MSEFIDSLPDNFRYEQEVVVQRSELHVLDYSKRNLQYLEEQGVDVQNPLSIVRYEMRNGGLDSFSERASSIDEYYPEMSYCYEGREMVCNGLDEYEPEESSG